MSIFLESAYAPLLTKEGRRKALTFRPVERVVLRWAFPVLDAQLRQRKIEGRKHRMRG